MEGRKSWYQIYRSCFRILEEDKGQKILSWIWYHWSRIKTCRNPRVIGFPSARKAHSFILMYERRLDVTPSLSEPLKPTTPSLSEHSFHDIKIFRTHIAKFLDGPSNSPTIWSSFLVRLSFTYKSNLIGSRKFKSTSFSTRKYRPTHLVQARIDPPIWFRPELTLTFTICLFLLYALYTVDISYSCALCL
jgi:hypothetical protein